MSSEFQIVMTGACCPIRGFTTQEKYLMCIWCEYASDNVATNCITRKKCHYLSNLHSKFQIAWELWSWIPFFSGVHAT